MNIDAYFERIGYSGPREPTLDTLRGIHLQHAQAIAFENLDPLLKRPVPLDLPSLERKLVQDRRGGYCFEQNRLLTEVLLQLGFKVECLAARVVWGAPEGAVRPRTHMLMRIALNDGDYLVDVGFGGLTLTAPLRLAADIEQETPHGIFRLVAQDERLILQALVQESWQTLYHFDRQAQFPVDYELANWYVSTHPQSHFTLVLIAGRPVPGCRYGLLNNQLSIHPVGGVSEKRTLTTADQLRDVLTDTFGLTLPDDPQLSELLARLAAIPAASEKTKE